MLLCLTLLEEGDFIFLASDGVADNFDPVIRKMARPQARRGSKGGEGERGCICSFRHANRQGKVKLGGCAAF